MSKTNSSECCHFISLFAMYGMSNQVHTVAEPPPHIQSMHCALSVWCVAASMFKLRLSFFGFKSIFVRNTYFTGLTYNKGGNRIQSAHYLYYTHRTRNARAQSPPPPPPPLLPSRTIPYQKREKERRNTQRIDKFHAQANPFAIKVSLCVDVCVCMLKHAPSQKNFTIKHKKIK